jgi:hypothetical protein
MMQPIVYEPILTLTTGLYAKPKHYADQKSAIGKTVGQPKQEGFLEVQLGNAQAWFYHEGQTLVLWDCYFDDRYLRHPLVTDQNMLQLWQGFERWLSMQFLKAITIATPCHDPIATSIKEYQLFLMELGYKSISDTAFVKRIIKVP